MVVGLCSYFTLLGLFAVTFGFDVGCVCSFIELVHLFCCLLFLCVGVVCVCVVLVLNWFVLITDGDCWMVAGCFCFLLHYSFVCLCGLLVWGLLAGLPLVDLLVTCLLCCLLLDWWGLFVQDLRVCGLVSLIC